MLLSAAALLITSLLLGFIDFFIYLVIFQKLLVCSDGIDTAIIDDDDTVRVFYGRDTLCDDQLGRSRNILGKALLDLCIRRCINGACGVVQYKYLLLNTSYYSLFL